MRSSLLMLALKAFAGKVLHPEFPRLGVYVGGLPDDQEEVFPFVVLRLSEGGDEEGTDCYECEDKILLHLGVMETTSMEEATLVCLSASDELRMALRKERILDKRYELTSVRVVIPEPERKQHDYHLMTLITSWNYLVPAHNAGNDYRDEQFVHPKE